ncbi:conserved hypothethical protein (plasmid) [Ralstonia solanacearum CMR15]|nr:conserved hypothethical protein [Ralstonia solanacearum CMR15]
MTTSGVALPTDHERKQIFYWLKQISSYTAWNRIFSFYQAWAGAAEHCARLMSEQGVTDLPKGPASDYRSILNGLAHCEEAVLRLKNGDKRIFKYDANGELAMANRPLSHWNDLMARVEWGEYRAWSDDDTPGWTAYHRALQALLQSWEECASDILEPSYLDTDSLTFCNEYLRETLNQMTFPDPLPEVPDPKDATLIRSGKRIPCSGIWEPVDAPKPRVFSLLRNNEPPKGPFLIIGTMSYLHGGSDAPNMAAFAEEHGLPATWRLIWRDTRYEDGTIPEEERDYVFLKPEPAKEEARPVTSAAHDSLIWAESGQHAPQAGLWLAEHDLQASVTLQAGEVLPLHQGRPTRWMLARA